MTQLELAFEPQEARMARRKPRRPRVPVRQYGIEFLMFKGHSYREACRMNHQMAWNQKREWSNDS